MRIGLLGCLAAVAIVLGGSAHARDIHMGGDSCGYSTDYDVHVSTGGIDFRRDGDHPSRVFMHDGHLSVDGQDLAVSKDDAARLRTYEDHVRSLLPEVAGIAREGVNIGFAAMRTVLLTFAENDAERRDMVSRLDANHRQALARIDETLGQGIWKQHAMDDVVEHSVQDSVSDLVSKVAGSAVKAALSGDESKVAALEARANSLDQSIDREVNRQSDMLDKRAEALCPKLVALDKLQQQFQFRLRDGTPLQLLEHDKDETPRLSAAESHARAQ